MGGDHPAGCRRPRRHPCRTLVGEGAVSQRCHCPYQTPFWPCARLAAGNRRTRPTEVRRLDLYPTTVPTIDARHWWNRPGISDRILMNEAPGVEEFTIARRVGGVIGLGQLSDSAGSADRFVPECVNRQLVGEQVAFVRQRAGSVPFFARTQRFVVTFE